MQKKKLIIRKKKRIIITLIILLCLVIGFIVLKPKKPTSPNDNPTQNNITNEINESKNIIIPGEKSIENFKFTDIKFERINAEEYEFSAIIENTGTEIIESTNLDIKLMNSKGEVISIVGAITKPLMPNEKGILKTFILNDIKDTNDVDFSIIN